MKINWNAVMKNGTPEQPYLIIDETEVAEAVKHGFRTICIDSDCYAVWPGIISREEKIIKSLHKCVPDRVERTETMSPDLESLGTFLGFIANVPVTVAIEGDTVNKKGALIVKVSGLSTDYASYENFVKLVKLVRDKLMFGMGIKKGSDTVIIETGRRKGYKRVKPSASKRKINGKVKSGTNVVSKKSTPAKPAKDSDTGEKTYKHDLTKVQPKAKKLEQTAPAQNAGIKPRINHVRPESEAPAPVKHVMKVTTQTLKNRLEANGYVTFSIIWLKHDLAIKCNDIDGLREIVATYCHNNGKLKVYTNRDKSVIYIASTGMEVKSFAWIASRADRFFKATVVPVMEADLNIVRPQKAAQDSSPTPAIMKDVQEPKVSVNRRTSMARFLKI